MRIFIVALLLLTLAATAQARTFYVQSGGSNSNDCTQAQSTATPKLTITNVIQNCSITAGDTIEVRAATPGGSATFAEAFECGYNSNICIPGGSSWSSPVILKSRSGDTITIRPSAGTSKAFDFRGFNGVSQRYIEINGFTIDCVNCSAQAIQVDSDGGSIAGPIRITHNDITSPLQTCIQIAPNGTTVADGNEISYNVIHDCGTSDPTYNCATAGCGPGFNPVYVQTSNNWIHHNLLRDNEHGIALWNSNGGSPNNNIVEYNTVHDSGTIHRDDAQCYFSNGTGDIIRYNIGYKCPIGIRLFTSATNNKIYNNTIHQSANSITAGTIGMWIEGGSSNIVKNNIFRNFDTSIVDSGSGDTISGNFCSHANTGCTVADPLWVDSANRNYSLTASSTAIDAGVSSIATGVTACFNGTAPDIGAIETLGTPTATVNGTAAVVTVPNNCTGQMLPASSVTGWTFKKNGSGDTVTANSRSGSNSFAATLTSAFIGGDTCLFSYSQSGNSTSDNNIGNATTSNQEVLAFTDAACTNITAGGGSVGLAHWKAYLLQGATDTAWTAKCSEDFTNCIVPPGAKLWVRSKLLNNSGTDFAAFNYRPKWRQNGGSYFFLSDSFNYGASCTNDPNPNCAVEISGVRMLGTKTLNLGTVVSNASATTQDQLTSSVANVGCVAVVTPSSIPSLTLANNNETECAHAVEFGQTPGDTLEMCPFTDTNTALTCSTPIKFTIGSYQSVR